jgi:hypothetical protein
MGNSIDYIITLLLCAMTVQPRSVIKLKMLATKEIHGYSWTAEFKSKIFLSQYWQKEPLLIRSKFRSYNPTFRTIIHTFTMFIQMHLTPVSS